MVAERFDAPIEMSVDSIGGIDETVVTLEPGVNVLTGRNATNRTSFLKAIMAALGSDRSSLKGDADAGGVELSVGDRRYTRSLVRQNGRVTFDGDPYLEDPEPADLFAFLLESNEARRAVARGDDLRELIMRPIDTEALQTEIDALENEKRELDERIADLDRLESRLPDLEAERASLEERIEDVTERIVRVEDELDSRDLDESRDRLSELEDAFASLREARRSLDSIEYDLETERESVRELEREREEVAAELDEADPEVDESAEALEGRIDELRERKRSLDATATELQNVIQFNESRLDGADFDLGSSLETPAGNGGDADLTGRLLESDTDVVCWTCGSSVDRSRIESTLERLRELHRETLGERSEVQERIEALSGRKSRLRESKRRRERLADRRERIGEELRRRRERIEELETQRDEQRERVADLESETESFEDADHDEVIERHRQRNRLELERDQLREERDEVEADLEELEAKLDEREHLEERRETVDEELTERRTRVERIETEAVDAFNDHIESLLSRLEYENVERIWIERQETTVREGRRSATKSAFDLHVVRSTEEGRTYEDSVEHLSESEREVTGLVFALAGYLVHEVYEEVPFVLLDSLEAIDSDRIASLVEYFEGYADCLVVALLPEDARPLPERYNYVTEI